jgi:hypothetical protein
MSDTERFREISALYARFVDRHEFDRLSEIMAPDASIAVHPGDPATTAPLYKMEGVPAIQGAFELLRRYQRTFHFIGQQLITELGTDSARGETYCVANHFHNKNGKDHNYVMYIRYQDRYTREGGVWKIADRQLIVDRTEGEDIG